MFKIVEISDHVRVEPELFGLPIQKAVKKQLEKTYENYIDEELGAVVAVLEVLSVGEGILIPGDAAAYYDSVFKLLIFKPELQELVFGRITQITNFGAFMNIGAFEAMIHISQTMDDYVSFSKSDALIGKNTKRSLRKNDICLARIVAVSYKTIPPKIGLTMRQPGLGKLEWIQEDKRKAKLMAAKAARAGARAAGGKTKARGKTKRKRK
ncbi:MAG: DNA-directed RNA polymerase [Candidatus Pacearchaeota archaeon]|nr:MAG: DNA-directed RNA polymerase [Candidatus Pacearchaeota archaeon]